MKKVLKETIVNYIMFIALTLVILYLICQSVPSLSFIKDIIAVITLIGMSTLVASLVGVFLSEVLPLR